MDSIDFEQIWNSFTRIDFALYDTNKVYLKDRSIPYDNRFLGNTSIEYEGNNLAIWYIDDIDKVNDNELASNMVHEMFHGFQYSKDETRFPDDIEALSYPRILENYGYKYNENISLVNALNSNDRDKKLELLKKVIFSKKFRVEKFGDIIGYEFQVETVEGSAEYCGIKALEVISEELSEKRIEDYKAKIVSDKKILFDIRRCCYYTGSLFLLLLDEIGISFSKKIKNNYITVFDEIKNLIDTKEVSLDEPEFSRINENFKDEMIRVNTLFDDFFRENPVKHIGKFFICGYDPMNMIKKENKILCSSFIMLMDIETKNKIFVKGPLVVDTEEGSNNVLAYYTID